MQKGKVASGSFYLIAIEQQWQIVIYKSTVFSVVTFIFSLGTMEEDNLSFGYLPLTQSISINNKLDFAKKVASFVASRCNKSLWHNIIHLNSTFLVYDRKSVFV